jgi:formylglycine-generating enzyme required for sulfatase activity
MIRLLAMAALLLASALAVAADRAVQRVAEKLDPSRKVALVIGNGAYRTQPLANPVLDATAMAKVLKDLGFDVVSLTDADRTRSVRGLADFKRRLRGAGVGLFYFAGHGIQMDGQNYLLPADTDMQNEDQVKYNTLRLDDVLDTLAQAGTPVKIVILDACRNNPFQRTRGATGGLAAVTQSPEGTLIAYSTAPGRVAKDGNPGENGLYTRHLLEAMKEPGRPIEDVFKLTRARVAEASRGQQVPWESTSLTGDLVLREGPRPVAAPGTVVASAEGADGGRTRGLGKPQRPASPAPGVVFRDCERCPEVVVVPPGRYRMGSPGGERGRQGNEGPAREVSIERPVAVGRFEVTFEEWEACLLDGGCDRWPDDRGWGRGKRPVIDVNWDDANRYVAWLSRKTGKAYRLLSEAEWEYAARAGTASARPWGEELAEGKARCADCGKPAAPGTAAAGSHGENPWKLADMLGNVWEWTADCYNPALSAVPADGSAATSGDCAQRSMRGGSWLTSAKGVRAATRAYFPASRRAPNIGFRVATTVD